MDYDLPLSIRDLCQEYKRDTACFFYWLRRTAAELEHPVDPSCPSSNEVQFTSDKTTTVELQRQVDVVEKAGKPCPRVFYDALKKAIHGRTQVWKWYELNRPGHPSNETHRGFVDVLLSALDSMRCEETLAVVKVLQPGFEGEQGVALYRPNAYHSLVHHDINDDTDGESVSYTPSLKAFVEEVDEDGDVPDISLSETAEFVLECQAENWNAAADLYAFFNLLQEFRDRLKTLWKNYEDGEHDLTTATITTTAVLHRVRNEEKVLLQAHDMLRKTPTYAHLATTFFYTELRKRSGRNPEEYTTAPGSFKNEAEELLDLVLMPTAHTIAKFNSVSSQPMPGGSPGKKKKKKALRPILPVPDLHAFYVARPDLTEHPEMPRWSHEDRLLSQMLMELRMLERMSPESTAQFRDEFSRSLKNLWGEGGRAGVDLDVHTVFCSRVMLDILAICGLSGSYHQDLTAIGHDTRRLIEDGNSGDEDHSSLLQLVSHTSHESLATFKQQHVQTNAARLLTWNGDASAETVASRSLTQARSDMTTMGLDLGGLDASASVESDSESRAPTAPIDMIHLSPELNFAISQHPLHCGTLMLSIVLEREAKGIELANGSLSIFLMAYLYSTLREENLLHTSWPVLERVIAEQRASIFGDEVPSSPEEMHRVLRHRTWLTAAKAGKNQLSVKQERWNLQPSAVSQIMRGLLESRDSAEICLDKIEQELKKQTARKRAVILDDDEEDRNPRVFEFVQSATRKGGGNRKRGKGGGRRQQAPQQGAGRLTPAELIDGLTEFVPQLLQNISLDYVSLARVCSLALAELRQSIQIRDLRYQIGMRLAMQSFQKANEYNSWQTDRTIFLDRAYEEGAHPLDVYGLIRQLLFDLEQNSSKRRTSELAVQVSKELDSFLERTLGLAINEDEPALTEVDSDADSQL